MVYCRRCKFRILPPRSFKIYQFGRLATEITRQFARKSLFDANNVWHVRESSWRYRSRAASDMAYGAPPLAHCNSLKYQIHDHAERALSAVSQNNEQDNGDANRRPHDSCVLSDMLNALRNMSWGISCMISPLRRVLIIEKTPTCKRLGPVADHSAEVV